LPYGLVGTVEGGVFSGFLASEARTAGANEEMTAPVPRVPTVCKKARREVTFFFSTIISPFQPS